MKKLVVGILAHVDAGKTTLTEGMLYTAGILRRLGRVDHKDAFLDHDIQERERGITIFSKQAVLPLQTVEITLMDTPGHVDFSSEMERTLQVLDYAILVISGTDGVQSHTRTVWHLLKQSGIPVFLFVNKMDLEGASRAGTMEELKKRLDERCVDFTAQPAEWMEEVAVCDESVLAQYLETGAVTDEQVVSLIAKRKLFPCYFGSALKLEGVEEFLKGIERYARCPEYPQSFGAKVYKIARDAQGERLTYLKVTGGSLRVKAQLENREEDVLSPEQGWQEKVNQIRIYSGARYQTVEEAPSGAVCAVTGLTRTYPGEGLGGEPSFKPVLSESYLTYQVLLPAGCDPHTAMQKFKQLEEEDPALHVVWNEQLRELRVQLMGEVQLEVLKRLVQDRFDMEVDFGPGHIVYRETIQEPVEGMGHFEPLRHYAEVHLLLEPGEAGSGLHFETACSEDILDRNWQRLILTHLEERSFPGVLTGSPITDMKITLVAGRAHLKHTEGGDFRQATYRAVRHGLMRARSILLEPWYEFRLEVPAQYVGRALSDLQRMSADFSSPEEHSGVSVITGTAPVQKMQGYSISLAAYSRGMGRLFCSLKGYAPCHNAEEVIADIGYDPEKDLENTADSVFCAHGAGFVVPWTQAEEHMHIQSVFPAPARTADREVAAFEKRPAAAAGTLEEDKELMAIFERTYGPVRSRDFRPRKSPERSVPEERITIPEKEPEREYLLVDGYNIIYAWDELKQAAQISLDAARQALMDQLCNYQGFRRCICILVFDAYRVPRATAEVSRYHNIYVVYTREAETADTYIERATYEIGRRHKVRVATSDVAEQLIVLGNGALRLSAEDFQKEVSEANKQIQEILKQRNQKGRHRPFENALSQKEKREDQK